MKTTYINEFQRKFTDTGKIKQVLRAVFVRVLSREEPGVGLAPGLSCLCQERLAVLAICRGCSASAAILIISSGVWSGGTRKLETFKWFKAWQLCFSAAITAPSPSKGCYRYATCYFSLTTTAWEPGDENNERDKSRATMWVVKFTDIEYKKFAGRQTRVARLFSSSIAPWCAFIHSRALWSILNIFSFESMRVRSRVIWCCMRAVQSCWEFDISHPLSPWGPGRNFPNLQSFSLLSVHCPFFCCSRRTPTFSLASLMWSAAFYPGGYPF